MARVMLVEDDRFVRHSLISMFRDSAEIVAFETLGAAEPHVGEHWDGMIIDQRLPDGDGLAFAIRIAERNPSASIVLFTASEARHLEALSEAHGIIYAHKIDGIPLLKRMVASWVRAAAGRTTRKAPTSDDRRCSDKDDGSESP